MAPRRATDVQALRAPYHTVLGDAIQLFQLIVINPAPIPIVYGAIETLIAEADFTTTHQHDPSGQRQRTEQATATEINVRIADTLGDLKRAVVVVIATSVWLAAADPRDPRVREHQRLLGDALTAVGGLSTVLAALHQAHAVALRGGVVAIPARPSSPLLDTVGRPDASDLDDLLPAGAVAERPAAPSQRSKPANRSQPAVPGVVPRRRWAGAGGQQPEGVFSFVTPPHVVVREEAVGISPRRSSGSGRGSMAAR